MKEKFYLVSVDEVYRFTNEYDEMLGRVTKDKKINLRKEMAHYGYLKLKSDHLIVIRKDNLFFEMLSDTIITTVNDYELGKGIFIENEKSLEEISEKRFSEIIKNDKYFKLDEIKNMMFKFMVFAQENPRLKGKTKTPTKVSKKFS